MRGASPTGSRTRRVCGELRPAVREARVSAHPDRPGGRTHSESICELIRAREAVPGRTVWKFGGTSVADATCLREMARIVAGEESAADLVRRLHTALVKLPVESGARAPWGSAPSTTSAGARPAKAPR